MADVSNDIRALIEDGIDPITFDEITDRGRHPRPPRRRTVARAVSVVVLVAVAVPVVLALSSARPTTPKHQGGDRHRVLAALSATIASGSFDMTFSQDPMTAPTGATTTTTCDASGTGLCVAGPPDQGLAIVGTGKVDTDPFAMVTESQVPGYGQISLYDDGTNVWEMGGGNYGLSPDAQDAGPGSPLSGFAGLVEGTLGLRQGALDMMGLASPTGRLELDQNAISSADQVATGTVDGVAVTVYQVTLDPDEDATVAGANAVQAAAIHDALTILKQQGYTGTKVKISIDAGGYIRRTESVAMFSDGATASSVTTFSNFGCAGTVLMPGQSGSTSPPPGCVSPDTATTGPSS